MYCSQCGAEVPDSSAFCPNCGTPTSASSATPTADAAQTVVEKAAQEAAAPSIEPVQEAASESIDDALARLKSEMEAEGSAADQTAAPAVAPVAPVAPPAEPASPVESIPAPQPTAVSPAPGAPTPAPAYTPAPAAQTIPTPAPTQQTYAPQPSYAPPAPAGQQAPGYAYQPAAATGAPMGATPAKKSPIAKIAIGAVVLALAGFLVYMFFGNRGGGGNTGGGNTPSPTGYDLFDSKGNPTIYSILELTGAELAQAVEGQGFSWDSESLWWISSEGNDYIYVYGNDDYEFTRSEITSLSRNGQGKACLYVIVTDEGEYRSVRDALDKLANIDVLDSEWLEDDLGLAVVAGPSGRNNIILASGRNGYYVLNIFNEEAVASGLLEEYLGDDYGSSVAEVWNNLLRRSVGGSSGASATTPSIPSTAPSTPTSGTLSQGAVGSIPPGSYIVGEGLPAGEYKLYADEGGIGGYYALYPDNSSTEIDDIIDNSFFDSCCYVTLRNGQYVEFEDCSLDPISSCSATTEWGASGIYKIGLDIPAATITLTPTESGMGYYAVLTSTDPVTMYETLVTFDLIDEPVSIEVSEGQYLDIVSCYIDINQ